jgi:hypothetical protein
MGTTPVTPSQFFTTYNFDVPCEGAKVIPLQLDFSAFLEFDVDLSTFTNQGKISMVQSLFIDNSASGAAMEVVIDPFGINQTIVTNPNTQGYFPILAPNPTKIKFICASGIVQRVHLINVPIAGVVWAALHP